MSADCVAQLMNTKGYSREEAETVCREAGQRQAVATKAVSMPKRDDIKLSEDERKKYGISDETYGKARNREFYKKLRKKK